MYEWTERETNRQAKGWTNRLKYFVCIFLTQQSIDLTPLHVHVQPEEYWSSALAMAVMFVGRLKPGVVSKHFIFIAQ
jgi:hypothetical protein